MKKIGIILVAGMLVGCAHTEKKSSSVFFPPLPERPRLQYLLSINSAEDIGGKKPSAFTEWVVGKQPPRNLIARPQDIASSKGKIYVLDRTFKKVLILDLLKREIDFLRDEKEGAIGDPFGICVTSDDEKFISDAKRKQILHFDRENRFIRAYGEKEQFLRPMDVGVTRDRLYVVDYIRHGVVIVDRKTGATIKTFGGRGEEEGKFNRPTHIWVDPDGNLYVNDSFNYRIQKFDSDGKYLKHFGYQGDTLGGFARPKGIAVDREKHLYAADAAFENVQIYDDNTTDLLLYFGGYGPHPGSMYLPSSVHIDYENVEHFSKYADPEFRLIYLLYVGNLLGQNKLNVYGYGEWIGHALPDEPRKETLPPPSIRKGRDEEKE